MSSVLFRCLPVLLHFSIYSPPCTVLLEARPLSDVKRLRDWNDLRPPTRRAPHKRERFKVPAQLLCTVHHVGGGTVRSGHTDDDSVPFIRFFKCVIVYTCSSSPLSLLILIVTQLCTNDNNRQK
ncbi:hypothetical protein OUZ56_032011 [Daphnia magna]|uniref:Secreted protein n=1 Tax=Daphnia magna TaxID=35525 RepID=A0ABQ9ZW09_9CRUS|nr:hypothetical protein OUZ56_032011 [Daphnia magna]